MHSSIKPLFITSIDDRCFTLTYSLSVLCDPLKVRVPCPSNLQPSVKPAKKRMLSKALVILTVALAATSSVEGRRSRSENPQSRREGRFSIFNVVTFKHEQCTTSNGLLGTCLTSTECTSQGGNKLGNCASGFGVCCLKTISTCGSTVTNNCTYIQNPGYPSAYTGTTCQYSVKQVSSCL